MANHAMAYLGDAQAEAALAARACNLQQEVALAVVAEVCMGRVVAVQHELAARGHAVRQQKRVRWR